MFSPPTGVQWGVPGPRCTEMRARLRVDSRQVRLLAVLDLQDDCSLDGVAVCIELVVAGDAREGGILDGIPDVRALDRAGSLERVEEQSRSVIRKSSECVVRCPILGRICRDESLDFGARVVLGKVVGEHATLDSCATYLDEVRLVPAIATTGGTVQSHLAGLLQLEGYCGVVVGQIQELRLGGLDLGQLGLEVDGLIFIREGFIGDDFAAVFLKTSLEVIGKALVVVVAIVVQHCGRLDLEGIVRVVGHDGTLERVDEAGTEDVVADQRDLGGGGPMRDHGDAGSLCDRCDSQGDFAHEGTDDTDDLVLIDELLSRAGTDFGGTGVVLVDVVDRRLDAADHCSARSIEFPGGHGCSILAGSTKGGRSAGHWLDTAQVDNLFGGFDISFFAYDADAGNQCTDKNNSKQSSHVSPLLMRMCNAQPSGTKREHEPNGCGESRYETKKGNHLITMVHSRRVGRKVNRQMLRTVNGLWECI